MCQECVRLTDEAESLLLLAEAEQLLVNSEAEQGLNVPGARRALFPHEVRAGVRFGDMGEALSHAERLSNAHISKAADDLVDELLRFIPPGTSAADAAGIVAGLTLNPPETIKAILDSLTVEVSDVLASMRAYGHDSVVDEASRQGVALTALADDNYLKRVLDRTRRAAAGVAASLWSTITGRVTSAVTNTYEVARPAVKETVLSPGVKGTLDLARQSTHDQHNEGRKDGAAEAPTPPARIYAGELLDSATCPLCYDIDGYLFEDEAEAERWYPNGGPMAYCLGGNRCRGTLIYDWSDLNEEFDGGVDKPSPPRLPLTPLVANAPTGLPPVAPSTGFTPRDLPDDATPETRRVFADFDDLRTVPTDEDMSAFWGGAGKGKGNHRPDSRTPGKTLLPEGKNWTKAAFRNAIILALADPDIIERPTPNAHSLVAWRVVNGILFKVTVKATEPGKGKILHAYPHSGVGVVRVGKDGKLVPVPLRMPAESRKNQLYYNETNGGR